MSTPLWPTRRLGVRRLLTSVVVVASASLSVVAPASAAPRHAQVVPPTPSTLSSGLESLAAYVPANSCDPTPKPGAQRFGELLTATYPGSSFGISRTCGTDPLPTSEHYDGRAVDWMTSVRVPAQRANAEAVVGWLLGKDASGNAYANARRTGVMYMIWNNRIWGSYRAAEGWRPYASCASHPERAYDTTCHRDHVHFSFSWEGAMARSSFWSGAPAAVDYGPCRAADLNWAAPYTGPRTTPCPAYPRVGAPANASALRRTLTTYAGMYVARGSSGPVVRAVQQAVGTGVDGSFGPLTETAVATWQSTHGVPITGLVDAATWRALLRANTPGATPQPGSAASAPAVNPLHRYLGTVLRQGSHGPAVRALQSRLRIVVDGHYGRQTRAAVNRFKKARHLPTDGVVRRACWKALGA